MNAQLKAELGNARQCLLETFQLALSYGGPDTQNPEKYFELAAQIGNINDQCKRHEGALECSKESRTLDDFEKEHSKLLENLAKKKLEPKKSFEFKEFKEQLLLIKQAVEAAVSASSTTCVESEDFVMQGVINVFDPLTKQRMKNPVRNTICGHHYDKACILEAIQINKRLKCPVAGCGNKQFVTKQHLQDDNLFKVRLQQISEQESEEE